MTQLALGFEQIRAPHRARTFNPLKEFAPPESRRFQPVEVRGLVELHDSDGNSWGIFVSRELAQKTAAQFD